MKSLSCLNKTLKKRLRRCVHCREALGGKSSIKQTVQQLDYIFDLDCLTGDGFPRVIVPPQGGIPLSGAEGIKFYAIKNGEKREPLNISISKKTTSPFH